MTQMTVKIFIGLGAGELHYFKFSPNIVMMKKSRKVK
jgi:hypothetical protein